MVSAAATPKNCGHNYGKSLPARPGQGTQTGLGHNPCCRLQIIIDRLKENKEKRTTSTLMLDGHTLQPDRHFGPKVYRHTRTSFGAIP
jgi:hypothetical protein